VIAECFLIASATHTHSHASARDGDGGDVGCSAYVITLKAWALRVNRPDSKKMIPWFFRCGDSGRMGRSGMTAFAA
jgi:hypothetical protein